MYQLKVKNLQKVFSQENGIFKTSDFIDCSAQALKDLTDCEISKNQDGLSVSLNGKTSTEKEFLSLLSRALQDMFDAKIQQKGSALQLTFANGADFRIDVVKTA